MLCLNATLPLGGTFQVLAFSGKERDHNYFTFNQFWSLKDWNCLFRSTQMSKEVWKRNCCTSTSCCRTLVISCFHFLCGGQKLLLTLKYVKIKCFKNTLENTVDFALKKLLVTVAGCITIHWPVHFSSIRENCTLSTLKVRCGTWLWPVKCSRCI